MKKKTITIDELAVMIKRGFDETASKTGFLRLEEDINIVKEDVVKIRDDTARLEKEIVGLRKDIEHLNRIPFSLEQPVTRMEDDIRLIKTKVGMR
jgi:predicted  nucleic acid-binding Zn-ribbon protein